jgi:hypothetical protein
VSEQILRAHNAQPKWAKTTWAQRQSFLRSLKAWVLDDMEGIVRVACRDTGKTSKWACSGHGAHGGKAGHGGREWAHPLPVPDMSRGLSVLRWKMRVRDGVQC